MTVSSLTPVNNHTGNGSVTQFDFDFLIENSSELLVTYTNLKSETITLEYGIDYTINEIGNENGSYILFPIDGSSYNTLGVGEVISLSLTLPIQQESEFKNSSNLNLSILERTFDYIVRVLQILNRKIDRSVKTKEGSNINPDVLLQSVNDNVNLALSSSNNSQIWAEGTDEEVQALGGIHSSKVWAEMYQDSGDGGTWGSITGTLSEQTDLQDVLDTKLENMTTKASSLAIGKDTSTQATARYCTVVGVNSKATADYSIAIGEYTTVSSSSGIAIGRGISCTNSAEIAIGGNATADDAIQIGSGTNSTAKSLQVKSYQLLDLSTGKIPSDRYSIHFMPDYVNGIDITSVLKASPYSYTPPTDGFIKFYTGSGEKVWNIGLTEDYTAGDISNLYYSNMAEGVHVTSYLAVYANQTIYATTRSGSTAIFYPLKGIN